MRDFASRLSHCLDYNLTCEIETAETSKSSLLFESQSSLSRLANNEYAHVVTLFRNNKFDMKEGSQTGSNSINAIHMLVFKEESLACIIRRTSRIATEQSKQRKIQQFFFYFLYFNLALQ